MCVCACRERERETDRLSPRPKKKGRLGALRDPKKNNKEKTKCIKQGGKTYGANGLIVGRKDAKKIKIKNKKTYGANGLFVGRKDAGAFGTVFDRVPCAFPRE